VGRLQQIRIDVAGGREQGMCRRRRQAAELDDVRATCERIQEARRLGRALPARRPHDHLQEAERGLAVEERGEPHALAIGVLRVVQDDDERRSRRQLPQPVGHAQEQAERAGRGTGGRRWPDSQAVERAAPGPEGGRLGLGRATARAGPEASLPRCRDQLVRQPGLPDPVRTGHERRRRRAVRDDVQQADQRRELGAAADERGDGERSWQNGHRRLGAGDYTPRRSVPRRGTTPSRLTGSAPESAGDRARRRHEERGRQNRSISAGIGRGGRSRRRPRGPRGASGRPGLDG
jgi:hypothetical protein